MPLANNKRSRHLLFSVIHSPWSDILKFLLVFAALGWLLYRGTESLGYNWQWHRVSKYILSVKDGKVIFGPLIQGLLVTFEIWITVTLLYLVMTFTFSLAVQRLENRMTRGRA